MQPELEHGVHPPARLCLNLLEQFQVPRVDHQRLFADHIGARAQRQPDVRVVQVVRRTHAHHVHAVLFRAAAQLFDVTIEPFDLGKEADVEGVAIENADGVMRIDRGNEPVPRGLDGRQVARRDKAGDAGDGKILHSPLAVRVGCRRASTSSSTAATFGAFTRSE